MNTNIGIPIIKRISGHYLMQMLNKFQLIYTKHNLDEGLISNYGKNINEAVRNRDQIAMRSLEYMFSKISKIPKVLLILF